ncbi:MAG: hypothetical protein ACE5FN_03990 [Leptospirillia bacterium]
MLKKLILWITALCMVAMLLVPPFHLTLAGALDIDLGYAPLWEPPTQGPFTARIHTDKLYVQWMVTVFAGALLFFMVPGGTRGRRLGGRNFGDGR